MVKIYIFLIMQTWLLGSPATIVIEHPTMDSCQQQRELLIAGFPGPIDSIECEVVEERDT